MTITDHELAARLADSAGEVLLSLREEIGEAPYEPRELKTQADAAAQRRLAELLAELAPGDAVLSEEARDDLARLDADRVWIIDPLDGTKEYSERDDAGVWRDDWAVHVALWTKQDGLTTGAVALPARGLTLHTGQQIAPRSKPGEKLRVAVSRSHPSSFVKAVLEALDAEPVAMGSAGVKAISVVNGTVDAYVHAGGQYQWDSAAPVAVARHAGMFTSRIDGTPIVYNRRDLSVPDLIVCDEDVVDSVQSAVAHALSLEGQDS